MLPPTESDRLLAVPGHIEVVESTVDDALGLRLRVPVAVTDAVRVAVELGVAELATADSTTRTPEYWTLPSLRKLSVTLLDVVTMSAGSVDPEKPSVFEVPSTRLLTEEPSATRK
jgi:hypothetical protein